MKHMYRILAFILLLGCLPLWARAESLDDFLGMWSADGVVVEIWNENSDARCRAVFTDGDGNADVWDYDGCLYDQDETLLQCMGVTRTRERLDPIWGVLEELSWSMNDMCFSGFAVSEDSLIFTDEALDSPITLTRLTGTEAGARYEALAFSGRWVSDSVTLRVEDHGVASLFTLTLPIDADTDHRWTYTCVYDADTGQMTSVSVSPRTVVTHQPDGGYIEVDEDNDAGSAAFALEDGRLVMTSEGETTTFIRQPATYQSTR